MIILLPNIIFYTRYRHAKLNICFGICIDLYKY